MEELSALRESLLQGDVAGALAIVEELEEMGRSSLLETLYSHAVILLLHLIKQTAEKRTTNSWNVSIQNAMTAIQRKNKRRKPGGHYCSIQELKEILEEAYPEAVRRASLEAFGGYYSPETLAEMVDRPAILQQAIEAIVPEITPEH